MLKKDKKIIEDCQRDDIPMFVISGKDICAIPALVEYLTQCAMDGCCDEHREAVKTRIDEFRDWQMNHPNRVHLPD